MKQFGNETKNMVSKEKIEDFKKVTEKCNTLTDEYINAIYHPDPIKNPSDLASLQAGLEEKKLKTQELMKKR